MDNVGKRGEALFGAIITRWCGGHQWFDQRLLDDVEDFWKSRPVGMTKSSV